MIYEEKYFPKNSIDQKIMFDPQKICQILEICHFLAFLWVLNSLSFLSQQKYYKKTLLNHIATINEQIFVQFEYPRTNRNTKIGWPKMFKNSKEIQNFESYEYYII